MPLSDQELLRMIGHHARTVDWDVRLPPEAIIPDVVICDVCACPVEGKYTRCYPCRKHDGRFCGKLADRVVPLSYAVKKNETLQQFYFDLFAYKNDRSAPAQRRLAALVAMFRRHHLQCLNAVAGEPASSVLAVPSGRGRTDHPLPQLASLLGIPLVHARHVTPPRQDRAEGLDPDALSIDGPLSGHVIVMEDTWVTGANAQSLAVRVREAGASQVSIVVLARLLDYSWTPATKLVDSWRADATWSILPCPVRTVAGRSDPHHIPQVLPPRS